MFRGNHQAKVDSDGRLKLPSAFKLQADAAYVSQFFVTSRDGKKAEIWPIAEWEKVERRLAEYSTMDEAVEKFMLITGYYGQQVEMDKQGRLLIPQLLRAKAGLDKDTEVNVVGNMTYLEVHNRAAHEVDVAACELSAENKAFLAPILRNLN